jgi:hypothetical protein
VSHPSNIPRQHPMRGRRVSLHDGTKQNLHRCSLQCLNPLCRRFAHLLTLHSWSSHSLLSAVPECSIAQPSSMHS